MTKNHITESVGLDPNKRPPQEHILVIKLGALGDFIQALGPMAAIRKYHKEAHITLLTTGPYEEFAHRSNYFDDIRLDTKPKLLDLNGWLNLRKRLIKGNFSRVYDLQNNDRTSLYLRLFPHNRHPEWIGVASGASHRNNSPQRTQGTAFEGHRQTLALAGINDVIVNDMSWIKEDLSAFDLQPPFILLAPGCSPKHPQKRWPVGYYIKTAQALIDKGYQIVLLGTDAEKEITQKISRACPLALDLTGKTSLFQIVALAHKAYAAIGNDTGPMHMIGPTHCPSIILFSSHGDPKKHTPNGDNVYALQRDSLEDLLPQCVLDQFSIIEKNPETTRHLHAT
ncbi:MAG: glycosyltransferase family 9 protein [Alphaproteobacteria bacterium]|nr:glycosyltransferase family 9 protein [Alphaproteobacteria bacterium]